MLQLRGGETAQRPKPRRPQDQCIVNSAMLCSAGSDACMPSLGSTYRKPSAAAALTTLTSPAAAGAGTDEGHWGKGYLGAGYLPASLPAGSDG